MQNEEKIKFDEIWGYQNEGIVFKQGCQNSKFNHLRWTDEIFTIGKNQEKIKFEKIWGYRYQNEGILLKQGYQNSKLIHSLWTTDKIFRIGKYEKIKFDKIWEYHNGGPPQMRTPKFTHITCVS